MLIAILVSLAYLILYCVQQLGVTLGVGAETVLLVAYLQSIRDGVIDDNEKGFARAVRRVKDFGLIMIIVSGIAIIGLQIYQNQLTEFFSVIVFFKWGLIAVAFFFTFLTRGYSLAEGLLRGLSAGTWYALFAIHILGPTAPWFALGIFYALWLTGFSLCWSVVVFSVRGKSHAPTVTLKPKKPAEKPVVPTAAPQQAPHIPQPKPQAHIQPPPHVPPPPVQPRPAVVAAPHKTSTPPVQPNPQPQAASAAPISPIWLHVMPKSPEDAAKHKGQAA